MKTKKWKEDLDGLVPLDYIHFKNETHNSLGFKSICAGFEMIYKDWKIKDDAK